MKLNHILSLCVISLVPAILHLGIKQQVKLIKADVFIKCFKALS